MADGSSEKRKNILAAGVLATGVAAFGFVSCQAIKHSAKKTSPTLHGQAFNDAAEQAAYASAIIPDALLDPRLSEAGLGDILLVRDRLNHKDIDPTAVLFTIRPQALAAEALAIMNDKSITSLFVVEAEKPVGILHIHDCLRAGIA